MAATPYGADKYSDWKFDHQIQRIVAGQPCSIRSEWRTSLDDLRDLSRESLNFDAPGISRTEREARVCNVQLALSLALGYPESIDGIDGRETHRALTIYSHQKDLPRSIHDPVLRAALLEELRRLRTK